MKDDFYSEIKCLIFVGTSPIWILALTYVFEQMKTISYQIIINELNKFNTSTQLTIIITTLMISIIGIILAIKFPNNKKEV